MLLGGVAVLATAALAGGVTAAVVVRANMQDDDPSTVAAQQPAGGPLPGATQSPDPTTSPSSPSTPPAPPSSDVRDVLPELVDFVEQERGLTFDNEVDVEVLDDEAFEERLNAAAETDVEATKGLDATFTALGLIEPDIDLAAEYAELLDGAVAGYYDPETDELVVRGAQVTPGVRSVVVHELTHALQDQAFDLDRPELDERDDETSLGFTTLVEGDAERVQEAYLLSLPPDEEDAARSELLGGAPVPQVPDVLLDLLSFPYEVGPDLVDEILDDGGQDALDEAFDSPPTTSEQLIDPFLYLAGERIRSVPDPIADGPEVDGGTIGQLGLVLLLESAIDEDTAFDASFGWGGDRYVTWQDGSVTCTRLIVAMDDPEASDYLREALIEWADKADVEADVVAQGEDTQVTSCA